MMPKPMPQRWTDAEKSAMRRDYAELGPTAMSAKLDRPFPSVISMAFRMGITGQCAYNPGLRDRPPNWVPTPDQLRLAALLAKWRHCCDKRREK